MNTASSLYQKPTEDELHLLVREHFHTERIHRAEPLPGGLFNTTYRLVVGEPAQDLVLRLGPVHRELLMPFEHTLMAGEALVCRLCEEGGVPCSKVLVCDTSKTRIDRDYMIVERLDSIPLNDASITPEDRADLRRQVGEATRMLHNIRGAVFGRASFVAMGDGSESWYACMRREFEGILVLLEREALYSSRELRAVLDLLEDCREALEEIREPQLAHADLWEGNILVSGPEGNRRLAAIIDGDRAFFGDPDFDLASTWIIDDSFWAGYGCKPPLTEAREKRRALYRLLYWLLDSYVWRAQYHDEPGCQFNRNHSLALLRERGFLD